MKKESSRTKSLKSIFLKTAGASEELIYHVENDISVIDNLYRPSSKKYFELITEAKKFSDTLLKTSSVDREILSSDIGEFGDFNGEKVPLDFPFPDIDIEKNAAEYKGKKVKLNKPSRGGSKKFYVYVKCKGKVKKISFGSKGMPLRVSEPERRKSFVARHKCKQKKDKCTAGYWACRIGRFPHLTGAKKKYLWW